MIAVALAAAAITATARFASATQVDVAPRQLTVAQVGTRPDAPNVLRITAAEDTWNDGRATNTPRRDDPRLAIADSSGACPIIPGSSCTTVHDARAFVKFDLSALPAHATIESATIRMVGGPTSIGSTPVTARRITAAWNESTTTHDSRPSTSSSGAVTGSSVASGSTEVLALDVTAMVAARGTATIANGWELRPSGSDDSWWYSSEWGTAAQRPTLTVTYR